MKVSNLSIAGWLVLILMAVSPVFAQSDRGGITGRVTDQTGAVVPDAKVTALNVETGETREARTNGEGNYTIPQLPAVVFTIKVEATGFKTASVENVKVAVQVIRTLLDPFRYTCGAPDALGAPGITGAELPADCVVPAGPYAVTRNVYDVVGLRPMMVHVRPTSTCSQPVGLVGPADGATE